MGKLADLRQRAGSLIAAPLLRVAVRLHLSANTVTVAGLVVCIGAAVAIATGHLLVGGLVVLFSGLFDILDGALARSTGKSTKFGALLDSVFDRLSEAALLFALAVLYTERGTLPGVFLAIIALVGSFLTSYVRARAEGLGLTCRVGFFTRAERVIILALGLVFNQVLIALSLIATLSYVTVGQRVAHIWSQTRG
ncbi:MAG: CDP-alcohol phosphatidyltransferase family protein [Chloroflexota bacterium]